MPLSIYTELPFDYLSPFKIANLPSELSSFAFHFDKDFRCYSLINRLQRFRNSSSIYTHYFFDFSIEQTHLWQWNNNFWAPVWNAASNSSHFCRDDRISLKLQYIACVIGEISTFIFLGLTVKSKSLAYLIQNTHFFISVS